MLDLWSGDGKMLLENKVNPAGQSVDVISPPTPRRWENDLKGTRIGVAPKSRFHRRGVGWGALTRHPAVFERE